MIVERSVKFNGKLHGTVNIVDDGISTAAKRIVQLDDSFIGSNFEGLRQYGFHSRGDREYYFESLPFGLIVGQTQVKQALLLAACNPRLGGVILEGPKGTGKSVMARSLHRLLPQTIERVKGSLYNTDPRAGSSISMIDSILAEELVESNQTLADLETESISTPIVTLPLNCQEDGLLGRVDLEKSMGTGRTVFEPGLLARAHRGVLLVDDMNLMDDSLANVLLNSLADGFVIVEREGLSVRYPCQPLLLATYNPDEGEMRDHLLDRIAIALPINPRFSIDERVKVVTNVEGFQDKTVSLREAIAEEDELRKVISRAREILPTVQISHEQVHYLCQEANLAGCEGQRAEIFASEIARTAAAIDGRTRVVAKDLQLGVLLSIFPRSRISEYLPPDAEPQGGPTDDANSENQQSQNKNQSPPPPPPPPSPMETPPPSDQSEQHEQDAEEQEHEEESREELPPEEELQIPQSFMFKADSTAIDPRLLQFKRWTKKGKGGKRSKIFNLLRGRFVKAIFPKGDWRKGHLAVAATLRAAAPHQLYRRAHASDDQNRLVYIRDTDFRLKRMAKRSGSLIIFVVDASGSMALNRMDAAKGAALSLLQEAYKSRDKICLIAFHGHQAEVVVPPTKSIALTRSRLEAMPCGGRSPLAHGLMSAIRVGLNAIKVKQDTGKVVLVLITDGRPTVPLHVSEGEDYRPGLNLESDDNQQAIRKFCRNEAISISKRIGSLKDFNFLVIDTEDRYVANGIAPELARLAQGSYFQIQSSDVRAVSRITKQGVEMSRKSK